MFSGNRPNIINYLLLGCAAAGLLVFFSMAEVRTLPFLTGRDLTGLEFILWALTQNIVSFVCAALLPLSLVTVGASTALRLARVNLFELGTRAGRLTTVLAILGLSHKDTTKVTARLGLIAAGVHLISLFVLTFSLHNGILRDGYWLLLLIGLALLVLSTAQFGLLRRWIGTATPRSQGLRMYLDVLSGPLVGARPEISAPNLYKIGRTQDNDLVLHDHDVIEFHVCIFFDRYYRPMIRAYAPIRFNGRSIQPGQDFALRHGDLFQVGRSQIRYQAR